MSRFQASEVAAARLAMIAECKTLATTLSLGVTSWLAAATCPADATFSVAPPSRVASVSVRSCAFALPNTSSGWRDERAVAAACT